MKKALTVALIGLACLALAGCASTEGSTSNSKAKAAEFAKVKIGMTKSEVASLIGKPKPGSITKINAAGLQDETWSYTYFLADDSTSMIYIVDFQNGKVASKSTA